MKRITSMLAAVLCAALLSFNAAAAEFESARTAVSDMTVGWNLGNTLDAYGDWIAKWTDNTTADYETSWGNPVTAKALIDAVRDAGFNVVRVPVTWVDHIDEQGNIDEDWLDRVQEVVDYVMAQGDMYCVLNLHHDAGANGWLVASDECFMVYDETFAGLWRNISESFRDYDERLIFESFNEMLDEQDSWNSTDAEGHRNINAFNQLFVDTVRATGGNNAQRNLMVQTYAGSCDEYALEGFVLPEDSTEGHLIIHVHSYAPWAFTSNEATWTKMTDVWGQQEHIETVTDLYERIGGFSQQSDVPLVMGEFGAEDKDNASYRAEYARLVVSEAEKYGIKCIWWDNGSSFRLFDRLTYQVLYPEIVTAMMECCGSPAGDADGSGAVNALDAAYILTSLVNGSALTSAADFSGDGNINALDAAAILRSLVGA